MIKHTKGVFLYRMLHGYVWCRQVLVVETLLDAYDGVSQPAAPILFVPHN